MLQNSKAGVPNGPVDQGLKRQNVLFRAGVLILAVPAAVLLGCVSVFAAGLVSLKANSATAAPGSVTDRINIVLESQSRAVSRLQFDICDEGDYLKIIKAAGAFNDVAFQELNNGCARVQAGSTGTEGVGPGKRIVINPTYAVAKTAPLTEHCKLRLKNIRAYDQAGNRLESRGFPGALIFIREQGSITAAEPQVLVGSRTEATTHVVLIRGDKTAFNATSALYANPRDEIECLDQFGFGDRMALLLRLGPNPATGLCSIGIYSDGGKRVVNGKNVFEIVLPTDEREVIGE
ncbi:MAG: hypothetical protein GY868_06170 [Deltaproteobacteria bacterium]|nr:hypothetical protein [Deltaproteobacteria bacterium]